LVNDNDPGFPRGLRGGESHFLARNDEASAIWAEDAGCDFGERRLPGAVCAHERDHLSATDGEIDIIKRLGRAESL
jgi:hypothetical protein